MNALICIGAGKSQYPIIMKAKELGYAVIAIDQNPEAPGFAVADEILNLSTFDASPLIEPVTKLSEKYKISGILNRSSGPPVVTAAILAEHLKLPYYSAAAANDIVQKHRLMELCAQYRISAPKSIVFSNSCNIIKKDIQFPSVIKPSLSLVGKSGISIVHNDHEIEDAIEYALKYSYNGFVTIDEYVFGDDISLISFVEDKELIPICILDEINDKDETKKVFGKGFAIPSIYTNTRLVNQIYEITKNIIKKFGIVRSPLMISFRINRRGNPKLIEIHLDLGGDLLIEKLFPNALNFNFLNFVIKLLAGEKLELPKIQITPSAILYEPGDGLISERSHTVIQAESRDELNYMIYQEAIS